MTDFWCDSDARRYTPVCGFMNWDTFTVAVNIENEQPLAELAQAYRQASMTTSHFAYNLQLSVSVGRLMTHENVIEDNVNWKEVARHLSTD